MSRWFRMYDELLDDPKVQRLAPADFKAWVNLLCLASKNDGKLPNIADIAFALRETDDAVTTVLGRLLDGGLIERRSGGADGAHYAPYKWAERQYKSDTSTDRVKRFRQRSNIVTETAPDTETEAETEREKPTAIAVVKKTDPKGFRLPDDWEPRPLTANTAAMVAVWPAGMIERELSKFRDYFLKTPGARGRSLDWDASYRNWLRNADERMPRLIHERSNTDPLSSAVNRILREPNAGAGEDAGTGGPHLDEQRTAGALAQGGGGRA